jgi:sugar phosphate permease
MVPFLSELAWSRHRGLLFAFRQRTDSVGNTIMQLSLAFSQEVSSEVNWTQPFEVCACNVTSGGICCLAVLIGERLQAKAR